MIAFGKLRKLLLLSGINAQRLIVNSAGHLKMRAAIMIEIMQVKLMLHVVGQNLPAFHHIIGLDVVIKNPDIHINASFSHIFGGLGQNFRMRCRRGGNGNHPVLLSPAAGSVIIRPAGHQQNRQSRSKYFSHNHYLLK